LKHSGPWRELRLFRVRYGKPYRNSTSFAKGSRPRSHQSALQEQGTG